MTLETRNDTSAIVSNEGSISLDYGQDPRADAVDAVLGLLPRSPGGNAFSLREAANHRQLLHGNAFYQAHWLKQNDLSPVASVKQSSPQSSNSIDLSSPVGAITKLAPDTSRSCTPSTMAGTPELPFRSGFEEDSPDSNNSSTSPGAPVEMKQRSHRLIGLSPIAGLGLMSPTILHPALRRGSPPVLSSASIASRAQTSYRQATRTSVTPISSPAISDLRKHQGSIGGHNGRERFDRTPSGSGNSAQPRVEVHAHGADSGSKSDEIDDVVLPPDCLFVKQRRNCGDHKFGKSNENPFAVGGSAQSLTTDLQSATHERTSAHEKALTTVRPEMPSREASRQPPPSSPALKLTPSPHVAQNAQPTHRAFLEERRENLTSNANCDDDPQKHLYKTQVLTPKVKNVDFSVSPVPELNVAPKSPKKTSFVEKLRHGWRTNPLGPSTSETKVQAISRINAISGDAQANAVLNAQPKARAILMGSLQEKNVTRTPSKKNFFSRRSGDDESGPKSPLKRLSFGFLDSPHKASNSRAPGLIRAEATPGHLGRSQSLKYIDNSVPPTPPAKNTPPHAKAAKAARTLGLGVSTIDELSTINLHASPSPTRFGTFNHLQIPQLVTKPSTHSLHASVVPELMDSEDFAEVKSRMDGLDLHGFSLPTESHHPVASPSYSPSVYSPDFGRLEPARFVPATKTDAKDSPFKPKVHVSPYEGPVLQSAYERGARKCARPDESLPMLHDHADRESPSNRSSKSDQQQIQSIKKRLTDQSFGQDSHATTRLPDCTRHILPVSQTDSREATLQLGGTCPKKPMFDKAIDKSHGADDHGASYEYDDSLDCSGEQTIPFDHHHGMTNKSEVLVSDSDVVSASSVVRKHRNSDNEAAADSLNLFDERGSDGRSASMGTVTIAYPDISVDPSVSIPAQGMGDYQSSFIAASIASPESDDGDSSDAEFTSRGLSCYARYLPPVSPSPTKPKPGRQIESPTEAVSRRPDLVLRAKDVGRGSIPRPDQLECSASESEVDKSPPVDSAIEMDTPRSVQFELLPMPLRRLPTLPISTFIEPPTPSRAGGRQRRRTSAAFIRMDSDSSLLSSTVRAWEKDGKEIAKLLQNRQDRSDRDTSPASLEDIVAFVADRDRQIREMLKDALHSGAHQADSPTGTASALPSEPREKIDWPPLTPKTSHRVRPRDRVTTSTAREFYTTSATNASSYPRTPSKAGRPTPGGTDDSVSQELLPASRYSPAKASDATKREFPSPALESSPDVIQGRTRKTKSITRQPPPASQPRTTDSTPSGDAAVPIAALEASLAKNIKYERTIQDLLKRLEKAEAKATPSATDP